MSADCLFCKIIDGKLSATRVFEDDTFVAIRDIHPQAKTHVLILPRKHIPSLAEAFPANAPGEVDLIGRLLRTGAQVARELGLEAGGFRSVFNTRKNAGQTVDHIHMHILGGEGLGHFGR